MGSVLGLVGQVSVYCDWVRLQVFPTALSLSQFGSLSNCLSRSVPEIFSRVAWTLSIQERAFSKSEMLARDFVWMST